MFERSTTVFAKITGDQDDLNNTPVYQLTDTMRSQSRPHNREELTPLDQFFDKKASLKYQKRVLDQDFERAQLDFSAYLQTIGLYAGSQPDQYIAKVMRQCKRDYFEGQPIDKKRFFALTVELLVNKMNDQGQMLEMGFNMFSSWLRFEDKKVAQARVPRKSMEGSPNTQSGIVTPMRNNVKAIDSDAAKAVAYSPSPVIQLYKSSFASGVQKSSTTSGPHKSPAPSLKSQSKDRRRTRGSRKKSDMKRIPSNANTGEEEESERESPTPMAMSKNYSEKRLGPKSYRMRTTDYGMAPEPLESAHIPIKIFGKNRRAANTSPNPKQQTDLVDRLYKERIERESRKLALI